MNPAELVIYVIHQYFKWDVMGIEANCGKFYNGRCTLGGTHQISGVFLSWSENNSAHQIL